MTDEYTKRSVYKNLLGRRAFLRATIVTAGTVALGCPADGVIPDDTGETGNTSDTPTGEPTTGDGEQLLDGSVYFPQSVVSGDPRAESVILWTRLVDPDLPDSDEGNVELQVATDETFSTLVELDVAVIPAPATFDRCIKAKVRNLTPATTYWYRFIHTRVDGRYVGPVGRTRTAPEAGADVKVRFAYVSCQDYNGRYYNGYAHMATMDLDFIVHLGDYVYETTGDPKFQSTTGRAVVFTDKEGAIPFNVGTDTEYYAAKSLDNYRELYRTYRSDPALRKVHELFPMICTWDDHEYSDDCHQDVATYFAGRQDEQDPDRRRHANQAWFEYMPVDFREDDFQYDPTKPVPGDIEIYRDFTYGKHMRLVMTDLRSHRTDHLIPEDGFPGLVVLDEPTLMDALGSVPDGAEPYVDIDSYMGGAYKAALSSAGPELDYDPAKVAGNIDVGYINSLLAKISDPGVDPITEVDMLPRGLAFRHLGKISPHASIGARYLVVKDTFQLWAGIVYQQTQGASQDAMGPDQEQWFLDTMAAAQETWKVWGNEYCLIPLAIDLTALPIPAPFNQKFLMNVDQWDGMANRRDKLLEELAKLDNVVAITGDIHAFYAGVPNAGGDPEKNIVELVTSGMSSGTFKTQLVLQVAADPVLSTTPGASDLAGSIDDLFGLTGVNPHLAHADSGRNGFVTVELDGSELVATYHTIAEPDVDVDLEADPELASKFSTVRFRVEAGKKDLYKEIGGAWKRWDPVAGKYA
ncbi:MAG: alkaline phosphatase D family protein [Myxococcales bacterium]|nr:alkaline phosphatase D family protein [Myxococcales bacterium]